MEAYCNTKLLIVSVCVKRKGRGQQQQEMSAASGNSQDPPGRLQNDAFYPRGAIKATIHYLSHHHLRNPASRWIYEVHSLD